MDIYLLNSSFSWFLALAVNKECIEKFEGRGIIFPDHLPKKDLGRDTTCKSAG